MDKYAGRKARWPAIQVQVSDHRRDLPVLLRRLVRNLRRHGVSEPEIRDVAERVDHAEDPIGEIQRWVSTT